MSDQLTEKYEEERIKRQTASKGMSQFLDRERSSAFVLSDPWIESGTPIKSPVADGGHSKVVVFGAGFGGILAAIKCLQSGAVSSSKDILIVDPAGGIGGTWYWNRYPGLMCDVESYIYLPLLEETGYIPTERYASGEEIRKYIELIAERYDLTHQTMLQSCGKTITWKSDHWECEILQHPKGLPEKTVKITADYVHLGSGGFTYPKMPNIHGLEIFKGEMMHTGRWNYDITGGTPTNPVLSKLANKRVAVVGTGATAVQAVPQLAKYAKELYVFQRTPSAVDYRGNRATDPEEWKTKIANKKGWQLERTENMQAHIERDFDLPPQLVDDGFTHMPSIRAAAGGPSNITPEEVPKHIAEMRALDDVRSDKVRARTKDIVKDPETAKKLQAWYPGWCKRPCFHDEYLPAFNQPNVHLVDTDGQGIEALTETGIQTNGEEYPIDVIVWSTGYGNPLAESLAGKAEMHVIGKNGEDMEDLHKKMVLKTLHGCMGHGFPNLFLSSVSQAALGVNQVQRLVDQGEHNGYILAEAQRRVGGNQKPIIEPTEAACDKWGDTLQASAHLSAGLLSCTPGYFTLEGDVVNLPQEVLGKMGRIGVWGQGYTAYVHTMEDWRKSGDLPGMQVAAAA